MPQTIKIKKANIKETRNLDILLCSFLNLKLKDITTIEEAVLKKDKNSTFFIIEELSDENVKLQLPNIIEVYNIGKMIRFSEKLMPLSVWVGQHKSRAQVFVVPRSSRRKKIN